MTFVMPALTAAASAPGSRTTNARLSAGVTPSLSKADSDAGKGDPIPGETR